MKVARMHVGIDFGTSNTSIARLVPGGASLIDLETGNNSIPTAIFYESTTLDFSIGNAAIEEYEAGEDGRLMRSIKSVLGSGLIDDATQIDDKSISFREVITDFLRCAIASVEESTGERVTSVTQGRPVSFNDHDAELDERAESILESCLNDAGIRHVDFLPEPVAAARSVAFPTGREKLIFVIDIGGGTSDFSVVRMNSDNSGFEVLGSAGVYAGGNDFDRLLSFFELTPLFGRTEILELNGLPVPSALYATLSDWKSLNKLYTRAVEKEIQWMAQNSPRSQGIRALDYLVRNFEAHTYAKLTENVKIDLSQAGHSPFIYEARQIRLEKNILRDVFETHISETISKMEKSAGECLGQSGLSPHNITDIVMVGGSTLIPLVEKRFTRHFENALISANDRFGAVAKGLALYHAGS